MTFNMTFVEEKIFEFLNDGQSHSKFKILKGVKDQYRKELGLKEIHECLGELINSDVFTITHVETSISSIDGKEIETKFFKSNYTI